MQHLDEGTIHTWLDGQLPRDEAAAVEAHVAECRQCADVVAEARGLIAASSRILLALDDVPALQRSAISHQPSAPGTPASADAPIIARVPAESAARRAQRRWFRGPSLAAAATIVVAVGTFALMRAGADKSAMESASPELAAERPAGPSPDSFAVAMPAPAPTTAPAVANEARDARADGERRSLADAAASAGRRDAPQRSSERPVAGSQLAEGARQESRKSVAPVDQAAASPRERDEAQSRLRAAAPAPPAVAVSPRAPAAETSRVQIFRGAKSEVATARTDATRQSAAKVAADVAAATGSIRGRVKDANGTGIEGAVVSVVGTPIGVTASRSGEFDLGGVPAGAHRLVGRHVGFSPDSQTVTVRAGEATTADITLAPTVIGAAQGFAIARAPAPAGQAASAAAPTAASVGSATAHGCYTLGVTPGSSQARADFRQVPRRIALDSAVVPARPDGIWYQVRDLTRGGVVNGVWRPTPPDGIEAQWTYGTKTATLRLSGVSGPVLRGSVEEIDRVSATGDAAAVVAAKSRCDER